MSSRSGGIHRDVRLSSLDGDRSSAGRPTCSLDHLADRSFDKRPTRTSWAGTRHHLARQGCDARGDPPSIDRSTDGEGL